MQVTGTGVHKTSSGAIQLSGSTRATFTASCVNFLEPQVRLFASNAGAHSASLRVSVQYRDTSGMNHDVTIGTVTGAFTGPSPVFTFAGLNISGNVQVTLTAIGTGANWYVSGVYIDPFRAR